MRGLTTDVNESSVVDRTRMELIIRGKDLIDDRLKVTSGKSLMQYIVHKFLRKLTLFESRAGESLLPPEKKNFYPVFR